jgi:serine/threonine-protein kinase RsbW
MYFHFINIASDINNIGKMEKLTQSIIDKYELNQDKFPVLLISITEAVSNAILHGNGEDVNKQVEIYTDHSIKGLKVQIKDQGNGFDFESLPDPTTPESIEEEGGRGIMLIKELCDEITFLEKGNIIEMFFKN